ncbi:MAG: CHC2 zinc finger domain-containing protein [Lachnospiraceae bacterium]|nr:CHC2 zinc finger domain-containing protein [Lachnospiraceae bacterium]
MNLFETVKASVSVPEAAKAYGITVTRHSMARCPFHDDRHPSLKLNPDFYYCFGCGAKGDVIDLAAGLFDLSPYEAARKIAEDFCIDPDKPPEAAALAKPRHPMIRAFRDDERYCQRVLCDYLHLLEDWKVQYAPASMDEEPDDRFVEACQMLVVIEYLADLLTVGDLEQRKAVVMELMKDGKVTGLEDRISRAREEERRSENAEEINAAS